MGVEYPDISVGISNFNGRDIVGRTIDSIRKSIYEGDIEIVVADDCSSDGSVEYLRAAYPDVAVVVHKKNSGLNAARNLALENISRDIVFLIDNDIEVEPDTIRLLVEALLSNDNAGMATPMILDEEHRDMVYSNGADLHYLCFAIIPERHVKLDTITDMQVRRKIVGSGGMMMIRKKCADLLGGFDEDFNHGYTEGEFTFRLTASGYDVLQVPQAKLYHLERSVRNPKKLRFQIRSRWDLIFKTYALPTLILAMPVLVLFESAQLALLTVRGQTGEWINAMLLLGKNFGRIIDKRKKFQAVKKIPDKKLLASGEIYLFPHRKGNSLFLMIKKTAEGFFAIYWALIKPFLLK